jgi:hypothetical protein
LLSRKLCVTMAMRRLRQLEGKVATLSVINDALQKENDTLREVRTPVLCRPPQHCLPCIAAAVRRIGAAPVSLSSGANLPQEV